MKVITTSDLTTSSYTWTHHSTERLDERYPEVGEKVAAARQNLETLTALAVQEDALEGRPSLEELFTKEELENLAAQQGAVVNHASQPKHALPKLSSLQAATCTVAASPKRSGRGAKTKENSLHQEDERLARVFYQEQQESLEDLGDRRYAEWQDEFNPSEYYFLTEGDPKIGMGPCGPGVTPEVFLDYRSTCYSLRLNGGKRC